MGYYKNTYTRAQEIRRYNAARRKAERLSEQLPSKLIHLETISEVERYQTATNADRLTAYNKAVEQWANDTTAALRTSVGGISQTVAASIHPNLYTDKYGIIYRIGFSFDRRGIYIHHGAGRGQGGIVGSKWYKMKTVNGVSVLTSILRHTDDRSLNNSMGRGNRQAKPWFDPVVAKRVENLADIVTQYFDTMIIDASRIFINR